MSKIIYKKVSNSLYAFSFTIFVMKSWVSPFSRKPPPSHRQAIDGSPYIFFGFLFFFLWGKGGDPLEGTFYPGVASLVVRGFFRFDTRTHRVDVTLFI